MAGDAKPATRAKPKSAAKSKPKDSTKVTDPPLKDRPDPVKPPDGGVNTKKQAIVDAEIAADRARVTQLSKEGKIDEARKILQPYVDQAKTAKTPDEKKAAMKAIIERVDVTSEKEKMFWSGNKELAARIATQKGKTILEQTSGGSVINEWTDLNKTFSWEPKDMPPHGWDLWGEVSANYSKDATGPVDVIQNIEKFPAGGDTWRGKEWPTIFKERKVSELNIFKMDQSGNILENIKVNPYGEEAEKLFGGK